MQFYFIFLTVLNIFVSSNAKYMRSPDKNVQIKGALKHSLDLKCVYDGDDAGQFVEWYKDGIPVSQEKPGHYIVHSTSKESTLTIKIFVEADGHVKKWHVKTGKAGFEEPIECQFGQIPIIATPQRIETDQTNEKLDSPHVSVRRVQGDRIIFTCIIEAGEEDKGKVYDIAWDFSKNGDIYTKLPHGAVILSKTQLTIDQIEKSHNGYYRCTVNDVSSTILLRVKDRLAALWPFLGIVGVVIVLVIIILISEKRERSTRQAATTDDEENDHANDPLVRSSNKPSDDENKKRAVKA
ncbi:unnamed protein product [Rotaria sp. Silwood2]|nr:unnamed protein product [Rotaria sp. Silwood2]CAF3046509.1 unnamed protein product [Rotaria sp. Silwood2]CAF3287118.1 unnamed protein product [Rotaria sp. Silwood2]CAF3958388.1 unnamed protein product [Rotaria sp. Silwood2]CAF4031908.1 unnamed protein product [Rotaria sp. Silwood2]